MQREVQRVVSYRDGERINCGQVFEILATTRRNRLVFLVPMFGPSGVGKSTTWNALLSRSAGGHEHLSNVDDVNLHNAPFDLLFKPRHNLAGTVNVDICNCCVSAESLAKSWNVWDSLMPDERTALANVDYLFLDCEGWTNRNAGSLRSAFAPILALSPLRLLAFDSRIGDSVSGYLQSSYMADSDARAAQIEIQGSATARTLLVRTKHFALPGDERRAIVDGCHAEARDWLSQGQGRLPEHIASLSNVGVEDVLFLPSLHPAIIEQVDQREQNDCREYDRRMASLVHRICAVSSSLVPSMPRHFVGELLGALLNSFHAAAVNLASLVATDLITQHKRQRTDEWFGQYIARPEAKVSLGGVASQYWTKGNRELLAKGTISQLYATAIRDQLRLIWVGANDEVIQPINESLLVRVYDSVNALWNERLPWLGTPHTFTGYKLCRQDRANFKIGVEAVAIKLDHSKNSYAVWASTPQWSSDHKKSEWCNVANLQETGSYSFVVIESATGSVLGRVKHDSGSYEATSGAVYSVYTDGNARGGDWGRKGTTDTRISTLPAPFGFCAEDSARSRIIYIVQ